MQHMIKYAFAILVKEAQKQPSMQEHMLSKQRTYFIEMSYLGVHEVHRLAEIITKMQYFELPVLD